MAREEHTDARTHNISKNQEKKGIYFQEKKKSKDHYKYKSPPLLCLSPSQSSIALSAQKNNKFRHHQKCAYSTSFCARQSNQNYKAAKKQRQKTTRVCQNDDDIIIIIILLLLLPVFLFTVLTPLESLPGIRNKNSFVFCCMTKPSKCHFHFLFSFSLFLSLSRRDSLISVKTAFVLKFVVMQS